MQKEESSERGEQDARQSRNGYEATFTDPDALSAYRVLLRRAATTHLLNFSEPSEDAFYAAGCFIVDRADAMVLVWNGQPAAGRGGTGDIARYISERGRQGYWINPITATARQFSWGSR